MRRGVILLLLPLLCAACAVPEDQAAGSLQSAASTQPSPIIAIRALSQDRAAITSARKASYPDQSLVTDPSGREWLAKETPLLEARHVARASLVPTQPDQTPYPGIALRLSLTPEGEALILSASRALQGEGMGMFVDGRLRVAAIVRADLRTHSLEFTIPSLSTEQIEDLVRRLNAR